MMKRRVISGAVFLCLLIFPFAIVSRAEVGDPQIRTDHPWYPGELAMSNFQRLFATQAEAYRRVTGRNVDTDQDKALASWFWRNTHYWHGEAGGRDLWGEGPGEGKDRRLREYWSGLFAYGFGLCGTTHSQWTAEFNQLLGHGRGRGVGAAGHNAFEVFLRGDHYGPKGRWALLDHDLSTVIFDAQGNRLLGLGEIQGRVDHWIRRDYNPAGKQQGWLVCGLHPADGNSYRKYAVAEYLAGYAGPPPKVYLRRGEKMRRYFEPGLNDGNTYVFWGRNYNNGNIPGPERSRTWVNQPEKMYHSTEGTPHRNGQARYANVEYRYRPDFTNGDYREGVVEETGETIIFDFQTPYIIGATPPAGSEWGIYANGCSNGLVITGAPGCPVSVSVDAGQTWSKPERLAGRLDLTDFVKGRSHYWLKLGAGAKQLAAAAGNLEIRTVCQANVAVLPRLKDRGTVIHYEASGQRVVSLGPESALARTFVSDGGFGEKHVTLTKQSKHQVIAVYAAAHVASGNPPDPQIGYQIEYRTGGSGPWLPLVKDWKIPRRGDEPGDFWSQSLCHGSAPVEAEPGRQVQVRFHNNGGKRYLRAEIHLIEATGPPDPVRVMYQWTDHEGEHEQSRVFDGKGIWQLPTGDNVRTRVAEFEPAPDRSAGR